MLRKQKGFQDEITFVAPAGKEAFGVSLWDNKESADAYNRGSYAEVTKILEKLVDGTPRADTYEVSTRGVPSTSFFRILRSEEHTSELQSQSHLVCRLLLVQRQAS